jgi:hypothetical protein
VPTVIKLSMESSLKFQASDWRPVAVFNQSDAWDLRLVSNLSIITFTPGLGYKLPWWINSSAPDGFLCLVDSRTQRETTGSRKSNRICKHKTGPKHTIPKQVQYLVETATVLPYMKWNCLYRGSEPVYQVWLFETIKGLVEKPAEKCFDNMYIVWIFYSPLISC